MTYVCSLILLLFLIWILTRYRLKASSIKQRFIFCFEKSTSHNLKKPWGQLSVAANVQYKTLKGFQACTSGNLSQLFSWEAKNSYTGWVRTCRQFFIICRFLQFWDDVRVLDNRMREQGSAAERGVLMNKQSSRPCSSEDCQQELRRRHDKHTPDSRRRQCLFFLPNSGMILTKRTGLHTTLRMDGMRDRSS